jgi:hypothetical protein
LARKWRLELAGSQIIQRAKATAQFSVAQASPAEQPPQILLCRLLSFL